MQLVNAGIFLLAFAAGSAALALWFTVRFPNLSPGSLRATLIHVGISIGVAQLIVPVAMHMLLAQGSRALALVAVCAIALPALTYCLLAAIWTMKVLKGALGAHR